MNRDNLKHHQKGHQDRFGQTEGLSTKRKSVLIVDDEPTILNSLSRELTIAGLQVSMAAGGEEAISRITTGFFDLVTTDLLMPGVDGFQVLETAKQKAGHTMVIILTGHGAMESAIAALRLGADDFLQKPCDTDELLYRISNCFEKQELLKKIAVYENFLSVCCYCRRIRGDGQGGHTKDRWYSLEDYFTEMKGISVSHGCCPDCYDEQVNNQ
jgi:DNA-binding response OmpR family regulator